MVEADQRKGFVAWATDAVQLVKAKTLVCAQAAIVNATGMSLEALKIEQVPYPRNQYDPGARMNFLEVQSMLPDFELRKHGVDFDEVLQVFRKTSGVYLIHAGVTHTEDFDCSWAETVDHYVVYNAGTRVLFLNPEVVVVQDSDLDDLEAFVKTLSQKPYYIRLYRGAPRRHMRRLWLARARAHLYPYHAFELL